MYRLRNDHKLIDLIPKLCSALVFIASLVTVLFRLCYPDSKLLPVQWLELDMALGLLSGSLSLWLLRNAPEDSPRSFIQIGNGVAMLAFMIGVLTGVSYLFGTLATELTWSSARMSPLSALCLGLMSGGLLLLNFPHGRRPHLTSVLIVPLFFIAKLTLIAYAYGDSVFDRLGPFIRVGWQPALGFYFLSIGILFSRPQDGPGHVLTSSGLGGMTARRLLPVVIVVPFVLGWLRLEGQLQGFYNLHFGTLALAIVLMMILAGVVTFTATRLDDLEAEGKKLTERDQNSRDRFLEVLNNAPLIVWALDRDGNYTLSEGKALESLGIKPGEILGKNYFEFFKDEPKALDPVRRAISGTPLTAELEILGRTYSTNYTPIFDRTGQVTGLSAVSTDISERKTAERDFETLANNIPQLAWTTDAAGKVNWYNAQWYQYTGSSEAQIESENNGGATHPDHLQRVSRSWGQALQSQTIWEETFPIRGRDGRYRWFLSRATPIRDSSNQVVRWFGTNTDIDDQRIAEQKVGEILETMSDGFVALDQHWNITQVNANHVRLTGLRREEQIGQNFFDVFPAAKDQGSKYWVCYHRAMEERVSVEFEDYYAPLQLWTAVNVHPTSDGGLAIIFKDVSAQKASKLSVETEKQKLEGIFLESPAAMALLKGPTFVFEKVNPHYRSVVPVHDLLGLPFAEAIPELVSQGFVELMERVYESGETYYGKEILARYARRVSGELEDVYFDFTLSRVTDGNSEPYGIYIHAMEVTDRVLARQQLERMSGDLQEALRTRDEFLSIASHELKTPLTSLKLQAQFFKRKSAGKDLQIYSQANVDKMVEQTENQATRLNRLVDDMLDISRIRSGKLDIQLEEIDLCDVVRESLERMRTQFINLKIDFPQLRHCEKATGRWDRLRLEQMITNLLTNAIRYGKSGVINVEVTSSDQHVRLSVQDQGIGIAPENTEKIFDRFERVVSAAEVSGLGLGLFITKQIVVAHGGKIWVESELGKGSNFIVEFPKSG